MVGLLAWPDCIGKLSIVYICLLFKSNPKPVFGAQHPVSHHMPLCPQVWLVLYPHYIGMFTIVSHYLCCLIIQVLPPTYVSWCLKAIINPSGTSEVKQASSETGALSCPLHGGFLKWGYPQSSSF